jgi:hypothetical protein
MKAFSPNILIRQLLLQAWHAFRFQFARSFFMRGVSSPQVPPQPHVQGNRNAHHDERTYTQDKEPPDHSHSRVG